MKTLLVLIPLFLADQEEIDGSVVDIMEPFKDGIQGLNMLTNAEQGRLIDYLAEDLEIYCMALDEVKSQPCYEFRNVLMTAGSAWFGSGVSDSLYAYFLGKERYRQVQEASEEERINLIRDCPGTDCGVMMADISLIWNYGCYCSFNENAKDTRPTGRPRDELDELCKDLHQCLRCVSMDNGLCDPYTVEWSAVINFGQSMESACVHESQPEGTCAHGTCCCMVDFYFHFLNNPIQLDQVTDEYSHANEFDHDAECLCNPNEGPCGGTGGNEIECCGLSPMTRRPYRVGGRTDCCENKNIYNIDRLQCCDDGRVIFIENEC